ncbi:hypothetical protein ACN47E_001285 [Coniothyrium glycines]
MASINSALVRKRLLYVWQVANIEEDRFGTAAFRLTVYAQQQSVRSPIRIFPAESVYLSRMFLFLSGKMLRPMTLDKSIGPRDFFGSPLSKGSVAVDSESQPAFETL